MQLAQFSVARRGLRRRCRFLRCAVLVFAFLATAPTLTAQEGGWSKGYFGVQLGVKTAGPDDFGYGLDAAVLYEKVFSNAFALRGKLAYGGFKTNHYQGEQTEAMLDLVCYKYTNGFIYPFAGVGYFVRSAEYWSNEHGPYGFYSPTPSSEPGAYVGLGHLFSQHFAAELKYTACEYGWVHFSLLWRF